MLLSQDYTCAYCPASISGGFHIDHMTPISRGGSGTWSNVALSCKMCNLSKGAKTAEEFMNIQSGFTEEPDKTRRIESPVENPERLPQRQPERKREEFPGEHREEPDRERKREKVKEPAGV